MNPDINVKNTVCATCLSRNRTLFFANEVGQLKKGFPDLIFGQHDKICWECKAMAKKVVEFKQRANKAQLLLLEITQHGEINSVQSLSQLTKMDNKVISYNDCEEFDFKKPIKVEHSMDILFEPDDSISSNVEVPVIFEIPKLEVADMSVAGPSTFEDCMLVKREQPEMMEVEKNIETKIDNNKYKIIHLSDYDPKTGKCFSEFVKEKMVTRNELEKLRTRKAKFQICAHKCTTCVESFSTNEALEEHNLKHSDKAGMFTCDICKQRMLTQKKLAEHTILHFRCFECLVCQYQSMDFPSALKHYDRNHRKQRLECDDCPETFQTTRELKQHRRIHKAHILCPECGKQYKDAHSLKVHTMLVHKKESLVECNVCHKKLRFNYLKQHMKIHDNNVDEAAFCAECCIQFKSVTIYKNHIKRSLKHVCRDDMRFKCPHCEKRWATESLLKSHMLAHSSEANFKCHICNKAYKRVHQLRDHISVKHEGKVIPRDKVCDVCGKAFNNKATLDQHMNIHLGHRPFVCEVCSDSFSFSGALHTHKRLKHGKKKENGKDGRKAKEIE